VSRVPQKTSTCTCRNLRKYRIRSATAMIQQSMDFKATLMGSE